MPGTTSLQEDVVGMKDWDEISTILDILSFKSIQEERSDRQLEAQNRRLGESGIGLHIWGLLASSIICSCGDKEKNLKKMDMYKSTLYNIWCCFYNHHF